MKLLVINGVNLNMLGQREPEIYGTETLKDIEQSIKQHCGEKGIDVDFYQSNTEGELVDCILYEKDRYDGIIANFGAYSHYSIALHDCLSMLKIPVVEVHLSNVHAREEYRHNLLTGSVSKGIICGFGSYGYIMAVDAMEKIINE